MNSQNVKEQTLLAIEEQLISEYVNGTQPTADDHLLFDTIHKFGLTSLVTENNMPKLTAWLTLVTTFEPLTRFGWSEPPAKNEKLANHLNVL